MGIMYVYIYIYVANKKVSPISELKSSTKMCISSKQFSSPSIVT